ncbi:MAG: hypothetical protein U0R26_02740 [Solirubrobacterales bacterium]
MLPLAHVGHYLWVFYVIPVLIVIAGILKTTMSERRAKRAEAAIDESAVNDDAPVESPGSKTTDDG